MPLPCGITRTSNDYRLLFVFLEVTCVAWSSKEEQSNALYLNAFNNRFCEKTRKVRALIVLAHATPHPTFLARMLMTRVETICMNTVTDRPIVPKIPNSTSDTSAMQALAGLHQKGVFVLLVHKTHVYVIDRASP